MRPIKTKEGQIQVLFCVQGDTHSAAPYCTLKNFEGLGDASKRQQKSNSDI